MCLDIHTVCSCRDTLMDKSEGEGVILLLLITPPLLLHAASVYSLGRSACILCQWISALNTCSDLQSAGDNNTLIICAV